MIYFRNDSLKFELRIYRGSLSTIEIKDFLLSKLVCVSFFPGTIFVEKKTHMIQIKNSFSLNININNGNGNNNGNGTTIRINLLLPLVYKWHVKYRVSLLPKIYKLTVAVDVQMARQVQSLSLTKNLLE